MSYHFVLTVQSSSGRVNTYDGVIDVPSTATRTDVFRKIVDSFDGSSAVLFLSLEPNQLS